MARMRLPVPTVRPGRVVSSTAWSMKGAAWVWLLTAGLMSHHGYVRPTVKLTEVSAPEGMEDGAGFPAGAEPSRALRRA
ncbi:hypothetical protein GALL_526480 [mine drainage metagenome]|uniref:Uncharacterized protein n=1 Tax=mine drainage metagenome TaxID=410659 RepID=A0A1J5P3P6_9ZZZZ